MLVSNVVHHVDTEVLIRCVESYCRRLHWCQELSLSPESFLNIDQSSMCVGKLTVKVVRGHCSALQSRNRVCEEGL